MVSLSDIAHDPSPDQALAEYYRRSRTIMGWTEPAESLALTRIAYSLTNAPVIVEIGTFLGRTALLLAATRKLRRSGHLHCVDPFDCSGDSYSEPQYHQICKDLGAGPRALFDDAMRSAEVADWITVHEQTSHQAVATWSEPIDLLLLSGHQSYDVVIESFNDWIRYLKPNGILAIHNSLSTLPDHDGSARLVRERIRSPGFEDIGLVNATTFARKTMDPVTF